MGMTKLLHAVLLCAMVASARSIGERVKVAEEGTCWEALSELQSCSGEVAMFFLNGETQLGANCCSAIKVIEDQCWPSMLGSLGITAQEGDVLSGYCHATATAPPPAPESSTFHRCYNFPRLQH